MKKKKDHEFVLKLNIRFTLVIILITAIPIGILAGFLFYNMEKNTISEHYSYMEYKMTQTESNIAKMLDSINMSTQFFLSDDEMESVLCAAASGEKLSTEELIDFQTSDIKYLERLVYNNPLLYSVRIYSVSDNVQEMMPVLYNFSRMKKLAWGENSDVSGWHFGYFDTAFSSLTTAQNEQIMSNVSVMKNYKYGEIGYIEAAVYMSTMFPSLYEFSDNEFSCFIDADGNHYYGSQNAGDFEDIIDSIQKEYEPNGTEVYYDKSFGKNLLISIYPVDEFGGYLIQVEDISDAVNHVYWLRNLFIFVVIVMLIALSFVISLIVKRMLRQLYLIIASMGKIEGGDLDTRIERLRNDEMGQLGSQLNRMLDRIQELMQENVNREVLIKNSEIRALQNQINAHFIYNVLETIKMMAEIDEEYEISDAITALGKLLRYSMRWVSGNVSLREELEYIKNYLVLMNLRYDFTIFLSVNLNDSMMDQELPKMSLQPIVENAVLHGIEPMAEDATIYIKGWYEGEDCIIEITDAGSGMTDEQHEKLVHRMNGEVEPTGGNSKSNGIGLKNVHDRIQMAFGKEYGLSFATKLGLYTKVAVRLPRKEAALKSATDSAAVKRAAEEEK